MSNTNQSNWHNEDGHLGQDFIPNFTQFPNAILDHPEIKGWSKTKILCLALIVRKTYGWHRQSDQISISQFVEYAGGERHVLRVLGELVDEGLIRKITGGGKTASRYCLNLQNTSTPKGGSPSTPKGGSPSTPKGGSPSTPKGGTQKKEKDNLQKKEKETAQPDGWPAWQDSIKYFHDLYTTEAGAPPAWTAKEFKALKELQKIGTLDQVIAKNKTRIKLAKKSEWWAQAKPMPSMFLLRWNDLAEFKPDAPKEDDREKYKTGNEEWYQNFRGRTKN
jgi:hypothetical protein